MALGRDIIVRLRSNIDDYRRGMDEATDLARRQSRAMEKVGKGAVVLGAAMAAGLVVSAKAAIEWESAFAGVLKTVDLTGDEVDAMSDSLRQMARELPSSSTEIANVASAAGQLGVKKGDILEFTRTMIDLGVATNLTAEEAATAIAQIANVMGTTGDGVARFGAALVELGNNSATTEADILSLAQRLSGSAKLVGASEADVLGLAAAMSSVGIQAEAGGSAMSKTMQEIYTAVQSGGSALEDYAVIAGASAAEFAATFEDRPAEAINQFVAGLGRIKDEGGNVVDALDSVGATGLRQSATLLQLSGAGDLVTESLALSTAAWEANNALVNEANTRYETTESRLAIAKNNVNDLAISLGTVLLPAIGGAADKLGGFAGMLSDLPEPLQAVAVWIGAVSAGLLLAGGSALILVPKLAALRAGLTSLGVSAATTTRIMGVMGTALKGGAAVAGLAAVSFGVLKLVDAMNGAPPAVSKLTESLLAMKDDGAQATGELADVVGKDFDRIAEKVKDANRSQIFGNARLQDIRGAREELGALSDALAAMVQNGDGVRAAEIFGRMTKATEEGGGKLSELNESFQSYGDAVRVAANETESQTQQALKGAEAYREQGVSLDNAYSSIGAYAQAMVESGQVTDDAAEYTKRLQKEVDDLAGLYSGFIDPVGAYTGLLGEKEAAEQKSAQATADATESSTDSWEDFARDVTVSAQEYLDQLDVQIKAQRDWADNLTSLAGRVDEETLAYLTNMGEQGAPIVATFANATAAELEGLQKRAGEAGAGTAQDFATRMRLGTPLIAEVSAKLGKAAADGVAAELRKGTSTVAQIAAQYADVLADGVNPLLRAIAATPIKLTGGRGIATGPGGRGGITFSDGGWAWGPGTGTSDEIPAWLSNGEHVTRESSARMYGLGAMDAVNAGTAEIYYADGGLVGPKSTRPPYGPPVSTGADASMKYAYDAASMFADAARASMEPSGGGSSTGLIPIMAAARKYVMDTYGLTNIGGFVRRNIAGTSTPSDHGKGKAIDVMTRNRALGDRVAADFAFGPAHSRFQAENVIWQQAISHNGKPFRGMRDRGSPTQNHRDHVHIDTFAGGGKVGRKGYAAGGLARPTGGGITRATPELSDFARDQQAKILADYQLRVEINNNLFALDKLSTAAHLGNLDKRIAREREFTSEWMRLTQQREQVVADEYAARVSLHNNEYEMGVLTVEQHIGNLDKRIAREKAYTDAWMSLMKQRNDVIDAQQAKADDALTRLNSLLDAEQDARATAASAAVDYAARSADLLAQSGKADAALSSGLADAARDLGERTAELLATRTRSIEAFARLDQTATTSWGNSVGALTRNAMDQADRLAEWIERLGQARASGVSEGVISALGLDAGPEALGQLRQFGRATAAEIAALNDAVTAKASQAARQSNIEQASGLGQLGRDLAFAQQTYATAVTQTQARYRDDMASIAADQAEADAKLLNSQVQLATDLAAIGQEQGRSQAQALAEGIRSGIPAVQAAYADLMAAAQGAMVGQLNPRTGVMPTRATPGLNAPTMVMPTRVGGVTVNVNAPVFGVDQLNETITAGVQRVVGGVRRDRLVTGSR